MCFFSMYSVLNTLSELYFYISKNFNSYTFLLIFKIVESFQWILNWRGKYGIAIRGVQNPVKYLTWSFMQTLVNCCNPLTIIIKKLHLRYLRRILILFWACNLAQRLYITMKSDRTWKKIFVIVVIVIYDVVLHLSVFVRFRPF